AVHLIRGNLHPALDAVLAGAVEEDLGAQDVGAEEGARVVDAAVDVALGGEVDDGGDAPGEGGADGVAVGDVPRDEGGPGGAGEVGEVGGVAGVGQGVEVDDPEVGVVGQHPADEVAADEPTAAGHQHRGHWPPRGSGGRSRRQRGRYSRAGVGVKEG